MLLFLDSFDHYADASDKYLAGSTSITAGRHGNGYSASLRCALNPTSSRVIVGAAFRLVSTFSPFFSVADGSALEPIASISTQNDGALQIQMLGGPVARSAADLVRVGQWHYIEVDLTITSSFSAPYYTYSCAPARIYLDGALVLDVSSLGPTTITASPPSAAHWTYVDVGPQLSSGVMDDLYIADGSGPAPWNAPVGDVQIDVIRPNGAGASTGWTPVGAAANWDAMNDINPDDETTYVSASAAGVDDLYQMEDIATGNTIIGAQILINARRTEEGFADLAPLLRHAGVTYALTTRALTPTYFYRNRECFVTMPNGDPLTDANVNALQAGLRRTT